MTRGLFGGAGEALGCRNSFQWIIAGPAYRLLKRTATFNPAGLGIAKYDGVLG